MTTVCVGTPTECDFVTLGGLLFVGASESERSRPAHHGAAGIESTSNQKQNSITMVKEASSTSSNGKKKKQPPARGRRTAASTPRFKYKNPPAPVAAIAAAAVAVAAAAGGGVDVNAADGWEFPVYNKATMKVNEKSYFSYFMEFMTFFHGKDEKYPNDTVFTREEMNQITPIAIHDWLAVITFGKTDYGPADKSLGARYNSLVYRKKALSYFMPYKKASWCEGRGNPTKSDIVSKIVNHVNQLQTRGQGAKSCVKRPLTQEEFELELKLMRQEGDWAHQIKYPTMSIWQFNFIGRIDDTCHHEVADPKGHKVFEFALQSRVRWSKNVFEEKKCPDQIILGAQDPNWCLQLMLSIYLESYLEQHPHAKYLFTEHVQIDPENNEDKAPNNLKNQWRSRLKKIVWSRPEFADIECEADDDDSGGGVGTHSRRKFATDFAVNCGHTDYEIEIRARWKQTRGGKVVYFYIGLKKAFEDASVCASLCIGGPIKYELKEGMDASITPEWIYQHVVPNINRRFPNDDRLRNVLGKALLYACLSDEPDITVPDSLRQRVKSAYNALKLDEAQPIEKVPLHIHRLRDKLLISEVRGGNLVRGTNGRNDTVGLTSPEAMQTLILRQDQLEQTVIQRTAGISSQIYGLRTFNGKQFKLLNNNLHCYGGTIQGSFVRQRTSQMHAQARHETYDALQPHGHVGDEGMKPAILSRGPTSLHALWTEYRIGLNGSKPAKQFTQRERNQDQATRQKYSRRKVAWDCIERLCDKGIHYDMAMDKIREVYGYETKPTKIIDAIIKDRQRYKLEGGIHPNLR